MKTIFGEKIRAFREDMNMTQAELGNAVNMTQRKVSYLERDKYSPNVEDTMALCMFFKVSADYLLDLDEELSYPTR